MPEKPIGLEPLTGEAVVALVHRDDFEPSEWIVQDGRWYSADLTQWPDTMFQRLYGQVVEQLMERVLAYRNGTRQAPHAMLADSDGVLRRQVIQEALRRGYV